MSENDLIIEVRQNTGYKPNLMALIDRIRQQVTNPKLVNNDGFFNGQIRLLAIVGDSQHGAFDAAYWKVLQYDLFDHDSVDVGLHQKLRELYKAGKIAFAHVALENAGPHFDWASGCKGRLVLIVSCPERVGDDENFRTTVRNRFDEKLRVEMLVPMWGPRQSRMLPWMSEGAQSGKRIPPLKARPAGHPPFRGVIIGKAGVGKTATFNKACGTHHGSGGASISLTKNICEHGLTSGDHNSVLRDVPAYQASVDVYQHSTQLYEALCKSPIHAIFIMVPFSPRYGGVVREFAAIRGEVLHGQAEHYNRAVLVVTKWDRHLDEGLDPDDAFQQLRNHLDTACSPDAPFICLSAHCNPSWAICEVLNFFMYRNQAVTLEFDRDTYLATTQSIATLDARMQEEKRRFEASVKKRAEDLEKAFEDFERTSASSPWGNVWMGIQKEKDEMDEAALFLMVEYGKHVDEEMKGVIDRMGDDMVRVDRFCTYVAMQKYAVELTDRFRDIMIAKHMSYSPYARDDPRNEIKQCPSCGCVWVRVAGCNDVQCGNIELHRNDDQSNDKEKGLNWEHRLFELVFDGSIIRLCRRERPPSVAAARHEFPMQVECAPKPHPRLPFKNNLYPLYPGPTQDTSPRAGCGARLKWHYMPRCSAEQIKSLYSVRSVEAAVEHFRNQRDLLREAELNIDYSFHLESGNFATSLFKRQYEAAVPCDADGLKMRSRRIVKDFVERHELPIETTRDFCSLLESSILENSAFVGEEAKFLALRMWTSAHFIKCNGRDVEFCHMINEALTRDEPKEVVHFIRTLNLFIISGRANLGAGVRLPTAYRGGGLPDVYRGFFTPGAKFRVSRVLPTCKSVRKADRFMARQGDPFVRWSYIFPQGRCVHVNYVDRTCPSIQEDEEEFLFPPYSVFTVQKVKWQEKPTEQSPHRVKLLVAEDNKKEPDNLPIAPWC